MPPGPCVPPHGGEGHDLGRYEYVRNGAANLFMTAEPLTGWRHVEVTDRRTAVDFAEVVRALVEEVCPEAERVVLVMDNLNTHELASLYQAFPPEQAKRIADRLKVHHTPKHDSWLNMAEIELSVLARRCLDRRIGTKEELKREVAAWEDERNGRDGVNRWQFTTADARIKLRRPYPTTQEWPATSGDRPAERPLRATTPPMWRLRW